MTHDNLPGEHPTHDLSRRVLLAASAMTTTADRKDD